MVKKRWGFSRQKRLLTPADYQSVFKEPIKSSSSFFVVLAKQNGTEFPRLGTIISKRVLKSAVKRNQIRRLIRESFRYHQEKLVGFDVVVMMRRDFRERHHNKPPSECLKQHWEQLVYGKNIK